MPQGPNQIAVMLKALSDSNGDRILGQGDYGQTGAWIWPSAGGTVAPFSGGHRGGRRTAGYSDYGHFHRRQQMPCRTTSGQKKGGGL